MRKTLMAMFVLCTMALPSLAQSAKEENNGMLKTVKAFTDAAREGNTEKLMALFDDSPSIMFVGGDSAEIWKGKDAIRGHLNSMFPDEKVILDMNRSEVNRNQGSAWVFADGHINIVLGNGQTIHALYRYSMMLVERKGVWKISIYHGANPGVGG